MNTSSESMCRSATSKNIVWTAPALVVPDGNGPEAVAFERFQTEWVERPAIDLFTAMVARYPDNVACQDSDTTLTFSEVWTAALRLAATIDHAVPRGAPVGVLLPNQAAYAVAVLACLGSAHPCVLIDRNYPQERVGRIVRDSGLSAVVLRRADIVEGYLLPAGVEAIELEAALEGGATPDGMPAPPQPPDAATFVVYTSGSAGAPKGIVLSQRGVLHRASALVNAVHLHPADKVLSLASPGTIAGLQQIFEVMLSGASLVKLDLQLLGLRQILRIIAERRITMMFSTPAVWRSVSRLDGAKAMLASLRCIQSSGDTLLRVDYELVRTVLPKGCHVLSVYGATEAPALLQWFVASPPADEARVPAGYPLPDLDVAILDEQDRPVARGEPGELVVRSRFTALGLWQRGEVVPGSLLSDPRSRELKIYRTGDLVRERGDGLYVVLGRRDRQIKVLGNRVELAEIETALRQAAGVIDAAAVARYDGGEPLLLGFVVPRHSGDPQLLQSVRRHLERTVPAYMRPPSLIVLDELPLLPGRKIDEEALLAHAASIAGRAGNPSTPSDDRTPSRRALEIVNKAWRLAMRHPPPGDNLSFEEAGGDSLQLLQLIFELERLAGRPFPMERVHARLNVRAFAMEVDESLERALEVLPAETPAIFLFPPGGGDGIHLTALRAACAARTAVRQVRYPDLWQLALADATFETIAAYASHQIEAQKPEGPLILAGYSDGGDVAYEAARQLRAKGRRVARLIVLDTDATGLSYPPHSPEPRRARWRIPRYLCHPTIRHYRRIVEAFVPSRLLRTRQGRSLLRLMAGLRFKLPASLTFILSLKVFDVLFDEHHKCWSKAIKPVPLDVPVILFRSQEQRPAAPEDLAWRRRTTELTIIPVPGDHATMIEGDRGMAIAAKLARLTQGI